MINMNVDATSVIELMKARRSVRVFKSDPITPETLDQILEAARWCQSASNVQPWRFIVVKTHEKLTKLACHAMYGKFIANAPVAIAIIADTKRAPKWYIYDTSMVSHQICLMAWALGIGTCWIGSLDRDKAGEVLGIAKHEFLTTILPLGYPTEENIPPTSRKALKEIVSEQ